MAEGVRATGPCPVFVNTPPKRVVPNTLCHHEPDKQKRKWPQAPCPGFVNTPVNGRLSTSLIPIRPMPTTGSSYCINVRVRQAGFRSASASSHLRHVCEDIGESKSFRVPSSTDPLLRIYAKPRPARQDRNRSACHPASAQIQTRPSGRNSVSAEREIRMAWSAAAVIPADVRQYVKEVSPKADLPLFSSPVCAIDHRRPHLLEFTAGWRIHHLGCDLFNNRRGLLRAALFLRVLGWAGCHEDIGSNGSSNEML